MSVDLLLVDDDLIFGFLQLHRLSGLVGLAGLALANDLGRRLEHADNLALEAGVAAEHTRESAALGPRRELLEDVRRPLDPL